MTNHVRKRNLNIAHTEYYQPSGTIPFESPGERKGSYPHFLRADVLNNGLSYPV